MYKHESVHRRRPVCICHFASLHLAAARYCHHTTPHAHGQVRSTDTLKASPLAHVAELVSLIVHSQVLHDWGDGPSERAAEQGGSTSVKPKPTDAAWARLTRLGQRGQIMTMCFQFYVIRGNAVGSASASVVRG